MAVLSKNFFVQPHKFYICFFSKKTKKFQNSTVTMSKLKCNASNILSKKSVGIHTFQKRVLVYTLCDNPGGSVISAVFSLNLCKITIAGSCGYTLFLDRDLKNYPPEILIIMIYFFIR